MSTRSRERVISRLPMVKPTVLDLRWPDSRRRLRRGDGCARISTDDFDKYEPRD